MNGLRWTGLLLFPLCGWLVGDAALAADAAHLAALRQTVRLLQRIRQEILFRRADLHWIFSRMEEEGLTAPAEKSFSTLPAPDALTRTERRLFTECISGLGHGTDEQEGERLDYYIARFSEAQQNAFQLAQARAGLPHRLGFAAGAVLALMIL